MYLWFVAFGWEKSLTQFCGCNVFKMAVEKCIFNGRGFGYSFLAPILSKPLRGPWTCVKKVFVNVFPILNCNDPSRLISHQKILWRCSLRCFEFCQNCYEIVHLSPHYWSLTYMYLLKLTHFWILCKKCIVKFSQFKAKIYKKCVCRKYLTNSLHECHELTDLVRLQMWVLNILLFLLSYSLHLYCNRIPIRHSCCF